MQPPTHAPVQASPANPEPSWDELYSLTLASVPNSARIYAGTLRAWKDWCDRQGVKPLDLRGINVQKFLGSLEISLQTRQHYLYRLRLAVRLLNANFPSPAREKMLNSLLRLAAPRDWATRSTRKLRVLTPDEADAILDVWPPDRHLHLRNRALVALLLVTGLTRSEAAALRWEDLDKATLFVRQGKRNPKRARELESSSRGVAIAGKSAITALRAWQSVLGPGRTYVFPSVSKGDKIGPDRAMNPQTVYYIVERTRKLSGITFTPQDARRTFIIEALEMGALPSEVKAQAGYQTEESTIGYLHRAEAGVRRRRIQLRYGNGEPAAVATWLESRRG